MSNNGWTMLMPIVLPIAYIFIKDWNIMIDKIKKTILYHHMSFSSSEIIRHLLVYPNNLFLTNGILLQPHAKVLYHILLRYKETAI